MAKKKQDYTGNLENCYAVRIKGEFICPSTDMKLGHSIKMVIGVHLVTAVSKFLCGSLINLTFMLGF